MERINFKINGLNVVLLKTTKFKTTDFILNFRNYLKKDEVTGRALVPYILKAATNKYPSKKEINRELEKLYGAGLGVSINKQGLLQIISFRISIINDEYLTKEVKLLDDAFRFLNEIVFNPKLENGVFSDKVVNEEKRLLKDHFTSLYDDKIRYAYDKLITVMCKEENYSLRSIGSIEDIDKLNSKNLYEYYQNMLNTDTVDFLIVGDIDVERVKNLCHEYLQFDVRDEVINVVDKESRKVTKPQFVSEKQDVSQAKLNIGYRTNVDGLSDDYYAALLLNACLGVYPHSLLFRNVREKESLCYYISSNLDRAKPIMIIYAGINHKDREKAMDLIREQIKALQNGDIPEELLSNSKKAIINDLLESGDNPLSLLSSHYTHLLYNEVFSEDEMISKLNAVEIGNIVEVANKLQEDTTFYLSKELV